MRPVNQQHLLLTVAILLVAQLKYQASADAPARASRQKTPPGTASSGFHSSCGSSEQVAHRLGQCLEPMFQMIEGRIDPPNGDQDMLACCERFSSSEKCVRQTAKDCLTGLPKTSISTVPAAIKRFRNSECKSPETRAKYLEPMKCTIKRSRGMQALYKNHTAITQAIRDLNDLPEAKIMKFCCLLNQMDADIERQFKSECPKETSLLLSIVHAVTDDARNTLCRAPKCQNAFQKVIPARLKQQQNFIEPVSQILFMLNTD